MNTKKIRRIALPLLLAGGLGVGAAVAASVTLSSKTLGAGAQAVSACDSSVDASVDAPNYQAAVTTPNTVAAYWKSSSITVSGVDAACDGKNYKIQIDDETGASIGSDSGTVSLSSNSFQVTGLDLDANKVGNISVVFYG